VAVVAAVRMMVLLGLQVALAVQVAVVRAQQVEVERLESQERQTQAAVVVVGHQVNQELEVRVAQVGQV
jgi:hypothetical protein